MKLSSNFVDAACKILQKKSNDEGENMRLWKEIEIAASRGQSEVYY